MMLLDVSGDFAQGGEAVVGGEDIIGPAGVDDDFLGLNGSGGGELAAGRGPGVGAGVGGADAAFGLVFGVAVSSGCPGPSAVIAPVAPQLAYVRAEDVRWTCQTTLGLKAEKPATAMPRGPGRGIG